MELCILGLVDFIARARIIGSITQYLFASNNRQAVIQAIANPECRIVTLTITEMALSASALALQGIAKFNLLRINEILY